MQQQQLAVQTAEENLADDSLRAPISGVVSAVDAAEGAAVPSPAVSIVGDGEVAQITLNETDAANVHVGQPATLTFDALPDLSLAGQVSEVDAVGTVSQGVVNYNVKVSFAETSSTAQVKPGMSVTANIVTQVAQDAIVVPNAAIKTQGTAKYILEPANTLTADQVSASAQGGIVLPDSPKMVMVTTGLSNDTETQIVSGVSEGDQIITQTIKSTAAAASAGSGSTSALRLLGGGGGFGGGAPGGGVRTSGASGNSAGR